MPEGISFNPLVSLYHIRSQSPEYENGFLHWRKHYLVLSQAMNTIYVFFLFGSNNKKQYVRENHSEIFFYEGYYVLLENDLAE